MNARAFHDGQARASSLGKSRQGLASGGTQSQLPLISSMTRAVEGAPANALRQIESAAQALDVAKVKDEGAPELVAAVESGKVSVSAAATIAEAPKEQQRAGIDRSVILANSKQILIDEKIRMKAYTDILLEYWSDRDRRVPGWVCKPLRCDYICYAIAPLGRAYLLPVPQLQQAWLKYSDDWRAAYRDCNAQNRGYVTVSCPVPVADLFKAIGECLRVGFTPIPEAA